MPNNELQYQEDEIDLKQLLGTLLDRKWFIVRITGFITILAIVYALLVPPTYKANISFLSPSASSVIELNKVELSSETSETIYHSFLNKVLSSQFQRKIFDENGYLAKSNPNNEPIENIEDYFFKFIETFNIADHQIQKNVNYEKLINISLEGNDALVISSFLNDLAKAADSYTVRELLSITQHRIDIRLEEIEKEKIFLLSKAKQDRLSQIARIEELNNQKIQEAKNKIERLRIKARDDRLNKIQKLSDEAEIANSLGIKENNFTANTANTANTALSLTINEGQKIPEWYLYGEDALLEEVNILQNIINDDPYIPEIVTLQNTIREIQSDQELIKLKNRESDAPFIDEINKLDIESAKLKSYALDETGVHAMRVNQRAFPPEDPIKPNKKLIVVFAFILGLMLSIFLVFILSAFRSKDNKLLV
jgi:LPS O-antigen subunit length determinant protein (WzzB/FepE family)